MFRKKFPLLVICSLFFLIGDASGQKHSLTGEQIVRKMAAQYAVAESYQDIGVVRKIGDKDAPVVQPEPAVFFKTYFDRPGRFRFEWEDSVSSKSWSILWSDGTDIFAKWAARGLEKQKSLDMGIAGATVATLGSARIVPTLLMRDVSGFRLTQMEKVVLVREEVFDGKDCFVVRGFHPYGYQIELWIGKNDFLLRKEREKNDDGTFTEEIRSDIKLNGSIPSEVFQYAPLPKGILIASLTHSPIPDRRNLSLN